jgi:hypothetical protein
MDRVSCVTTDLILSAGPHASTELAIPPSQPYQAKVHLSKENRQNLFENWDFAQMAECRAG